MIVKLQKQHSDYPDLTPGQLYVVIGIEADDLRILNDHGRPFLYPPERFEVVDPQAPADWVSEIGKDGERSAKIRMIRVLFLGIIAASAVPPAPPPDAAHVDPLRRKSAGDSSRPQPRSPSLSLRRARRAAN